jgi:hypothetical protein
MDSNSSGTQQVKFIGKETKRKSEKSICISEDLSNLGYY